MADADHQPAVPSLEEVRARLDVIDSSILALIDERAGLAGQVAAAKAAAGDAGKFALRPGREAQLIRRLLARPRKDAAMGVIIRVWRELMADSLSRQGPFHVSVFGGRDPVRSLDAARVRFGVAPPMRMVGKADDAIAAARTPGGVAVLSLASDTPWWGRLLAEPNLRVFAALPCLNAWGPASALAVAAVEVEPTGGDQTFWVTDAPGPAASVVAALARDGAAAELLAEAGGLRLFTLAGYYQPEDERLARAPGRLSGVIGAAPDPFDV